MLMLIMFAVTWGLNRLMERGGDTMSTSTTSRTQVALNYALIVLCTLIAVYPLVGVVPREPVSDRAGRAAVGLRAAPVFDWHNYVDAWNQGGFGYSFKTSIIVALVMVPASVLLSVLAGYAFATMHFWGAKVLFYLFILGLIIPTEATIVPLYYDMRAVGLLDTYWVLILLETSGEVAFGIFWMR